MLEAGAERLHLGREPGAHRARRCAAIERTGRQALEEMRRLLGVLRDGDDEPALAPQPSLARLDELVEHVRPRRASRSTCASTGSRSSCPRARRQRLPDRQEALTNVLKHAGAATRRRSSSAYEDGALVLEVDRRRRGDDADGAGGHGLTGHARARRAVRRRARGRRPRRRAASPCGRGSRWRAARERHACCIADDQAVVRAGLRRDPRGRRRAARSSARSRTGVGAVEAARAPAAATWS